MCISNMTSRRALSTLPPQMKHWIYCSFSLPRSYPYAPRAAVPTSPRHRPPTTATHLCRCTWKLLFFIQIQIHMGIIIIISSMEKKSLLFASSRLPLCSQTWIDDFVIRPSFSIGNLPKLRGKSAPTPRCARTRRVKPGPATTNPPVPSPV